MRYVGTQELAETLGVSPQTLWPLADEADCPAIRINTLIRCGFLSLGQPMGE